MHRQTSVLCHRYYITHTHTHASLLRALVLFLYLFYVFQFLSVSSYHHHTVDPHYSSFFFPLITYPSLFVILISSISFPLVFTLLLLLLLLLFTLMVISCTYLIRVRVTRLRSARIVSPRDRCARSFPVRTRIFIFLNEVILSDFTRVFSRKSASSTINNLELPDVELPLPQILIAESPSIELLLSRFAEKRVRCQCRFAAHGTLHVRFFFSRSFLFFFYQRITINEKETLLLWPSKTRENLEPDEMFKVDRFASMLTKRLNTYYVTINYK